MTKPNVLFIMCDQLRVDAIAALGNSVVRTPNFDRLVRRGISFSNGYSSCPVCIPARYTIRTGCEPYTTGVYKNGMPNLAQGQVKDMEKRCGKYLAKTMGEAGYRTFGIGKFHTTPWDEDVGYEVQLHSEELYGTEDQRARDSYASFIAREHPEFDFIEQLHGERTEMYYMPQMSPLPAEITVEAWTADCAVKQLLVEDSRPYFGFVSFIGPHPPCAPPIPYNRMYNPDIISNPVRGDLSVDHMDEHLSWMNYLIWADDINDFQARVLKARYYGEVSYIDSCLGKILDAVEARDDADNTLICFFSDHGDHLGDHSAWQKESFFESSCNIPFLLSWPEKLEKNVQRDDLVCLSDLFAIATKAAGALQVRDGIDVLGSLTEKTVGREYMFGFYEIPGERYFKIMVRGKEWKYIFMANGGREQLFNIEKDPYELTQLTDKEPNITEHMRRVAINELKKHISTQRALGIDGDSLLKFEFKARPYQRIHQFDSSKGISDFIVNGRDN